MVWEGEGGWEEEGWGWGGGVRGLGGGEGGLWSLLLCIRQSASNCDLSHEIVIYGQANLLY